jgi:glycosyltransferase involved in cell wall biosynthesis
LKNILWLASWYPNKLDRFEGDFIQRHAQATALYCKVHVIFIKKDIELKPGTTETEKHNSDNLSEEIIYYNSLRTGIKLFDKFLSHRSYKKHFREAVKKYIDVSAILDFVHVHVAMKAGLTAIWIKKKWNIPFVVTEHWVGYYRECVPSIYDRNWLFRRLNRKILSKAELFIPVTEDLGRLVNQSFFNVPYKVVPNVVKTNYFKYKALESVKFRFIHISYMTFQKNPEGIFKAARQLKDRGYAFEILMLGNKNKALSEMAGRYNLLTDTVIFQKAVPYADVAVQIQRASALILFSRFENLPCVMLEALCCGLPVISSNVGGIAEVITHENGILVENENIDELANAMQRIMDDYHIYNRQIIAADATARFNYSVVGKQIESLYK